MLLSSVSGAPLTTPLLDDHEVDDAHRGQREQEDRRPDAESAQREDTENQADDSAEAGQGEPEVQRAVRRKCHAHTVPATAPCRTLRV